MCKIEQSNRNIKAHIMLGVHDIRHLFHKNFSLAIVFELNYFCVEIRTSEKFIVSTKRGIKGDRLDKWDILFKSRTSGYLINIREDLERPARSA